MERCVERKIDEEEGILAFDGFREHSSCAQFPIPSAEPWALVRVEEFVTFEPPVESVEPRPPVDARVDDLQ